MDKVKHLLPKFKSRLTTKIDADDTSIVLETVTGIPTAPFMAILDDSKSTAECVWVTDVTTVTKTLTVTRAQRGTTGVEHVVGTLLFHSEVPLADLGFFETWETAGETGRPLESKLITDVLLGGYANGLKGYVDCNDTGGSTGLLSGVNGEIRLPNGAGRGAYYGLESEVVFQTSSTITPWGSDAGFLYCGASGAGIADFDTDGKFMLITGLTPAIGKLLSADMHTLKCSMVVAGTHYAKYLVLSIAENMLSHSFSDMPAGDAYSGLKILVTADVPANELGLSAYFQASLTGVCADHVYGVGSWINTGADFTSTASEIIVPFEGGIYTAAANATGRFVFAGQHQAILAGVPDSLHAWRLNANQTITALIAAANAGSVGYAADATTDSNKCGDIPIADVVGHGVVYVRCYDAAS